MQNNKIDMKGLTKKQKKVLFRIALGTLLTLIFYLLPTAGILRLVSFMLPYGIAGYDVLIKSAKNIAAGQVFDENFLMSVATIGAFFIGEYTEAAAVMLFYQTGELFSSIAVGKSRRSIAALMDIRPDTARVLRDGKESVVDPEAVCLGESLVIKAGERIPLDGVIISGSTSVDNSSLTGESIPLELTEGDTVLSGAVNLNGVITVRTTSEWTNSTVARILELTENAAEKKAVCENFITKFARFYTPIVVISALFLGIVPSIIFGGWGKWIKRALIFLVVSCPCALVVSVPLTFFGGIGGAGKRGILFKGASSIEALTKVNAVVFDKTGTLTEGGFSVSGIYPEGISEEELLRIAASIEKGSNHPIARPIVAAVPEDRLFKADNISEISGKGIEAVINNKRYYLGNRKLMESRGVEIPQKVLEGTLVYLACGDEYLGAVRLEDAIKPDAARLIRSLKELHIDKTVMLTGDSKNTAERVRGALGIDSYFAELLPADKVEKLEELIDSGYSVAFVGDGINDAPVLSRAHVGIAMGGLGSDAAIEAADLVIMDDKPSKIADAVKLSRRIMNIVRQNIVFALAVKGLILLLGAFGIANMWIAVFGDVGVSVLAILNAMRALNTKNI